MIDFKTLSHDDITRIEMNARHGRALYLRDLAFAIAARAKAVFAADLAQVAAPKTGRIA